MRQLGFQYYSVATRLPANRSVAFRLCLTTDLALFWIETVFQFLLYYIKISITCLI